MDKRAHSNDLGWEYGIMVGRKNRFKCKYCCKIIPGSITNFKRHFIEKLPAAGPCESATEEVREKIKEHFNQKKRTGRSDVACSSGTSKIMTRQTTLGHGISENVLAESIDGFPTSIPCEELTTCKRKRTDIKDQMGPRHSEKDYVQSFCASSPPMYTRAGRLRGARGRSLFSKEHQKLNTDVFESYLEHLWSNISDEMKHSCTYLDCLWFSLYKEGPSQVKLLKWIKKKQIFSRKYTFVPIVCWRHWSLLILCHFGESFLSETKKPCMLLLDSLGKADPMRLEPDIRRFVSDIYKSEGFDEDSIAKIPFLVPKNAPEAFSQHGYPYFLTEKWFSWEDMESFHNEFIQFASAQHSIKQKGRSSQ